MEVLINQGVFRIYHAGNEEEKKKAPRLMISKQV